MRSRMLTGTAPWHPWPSERYSQSDARAFLTRVLDFSLCAGFRMPAMTSLSTDSRGRRPKSAKARNRGGVGHPAVQRTLWGFCVSESAGEVKPRPAMRSPWLERGGEDLRDI